jgi:hypothetical protein
MKFSTLTGSFSYDGINEFLRDLSYGKGRTNPIKGGLPYVNSFHPGRVFFRNVRAPDVMLDILYGFFFFGLWNGRFFLARS